MVDDGLNLRSDKVAKSGLKAVLEVEGILRTPVKEESRFGAYGQPEGESSAKGTQLKVVLDDATIIRMREGEQEPELKDGKFTVWFKYSKKPLSLAIEPQSGTFLAKYFIPDGEALAAKRLGVKAEPGLLSNLYDTRVRLVFKEVPMTIENRETGEKKSVTMTGYTFSDETMTPADITGHIKALVVGKTLPAAKRALAMDSVAKTHPEYKSALDSGELAPMLGIKVDTESEKFVEVTANGNGT